MPGNDQSMGLGAAQVPAGLASPTANGGSRDKFYRLTAQNVNQTLTDLGSFTGLPASYRVRRLIALNGSISLTLATVDLRTAAAGAGTAIVAAQALSPITGAGLAIDLTLAVTTGIQTASSLVMRAVTAQGAAATCDFLLEIDDLT
jgi:hypothetical protein